MSPSSQDEDGKVADSEFIIIIIMIVNYIAGRYELVC